MVSVAEIESVAEKLKNPTAPSIDETPPEVIKGKGVPGLPEGSN